MVASDAATASTLANLPFHFRLLAINTCPHDQPGG